MAKELAGDEWDLGELGGLSADDLWTWAKTESMGYDGHAYLAMDMRVNLERERWFESRICMWRKHRSVYQDHMKYICNDIVNPFSVKIFRDAERVREMYD